MKKIRKSLGIMFLVFSFVVFGFSGNLAEAVTYTAAEVATHNTSSNCWVIVNGNVYNLTSFISQHSGGQSAIVSVCGTDGTASFNSGPHGSSTLNAINSNIIGTLGTSTQNPVLTTLTVTPLSPSVVVGGTQQLSASTKDQNGTSIAAALTFASSNTSVATVNSSTGLVTAVSVGSATITTTAVKDSVTLSVTNTITVTNVAPTKVLTSVTISPLTSSLSVGGTSQLAAQPKDQNDAAFVGATNTFASSNTSVATVNSTTGLVTGMSAGTATITVTSMSGNVTVTGSSSVTVSSVISGGGDDDDYGNDDYDDDYGDDSDEAMENENEDDEDEMDNHDYSENHYGNYSHEREDGGSRFYDRSDSRDNDEEDD